jgi:hypothetical protein
MVGLGIDRDHARRGRVRNPAVERLLGRDALIILVDEGGLLLRTCVIGAGRRRCRARRPTFISSDLKP